jgi:hypothetical protein
MSSFEEIALQNMFDNTKSHDPLDCLVELGENDRCDPTKIKDGSLLYRPARIVVLSAEDSTMRNQDLYNDGGDSDWLVGKNLIRKQCWSPDQYTKIKRVSKSEIAEIITNEIGDCVCKMMFTKIPDANDMAVFLREGSQLIESLESTDAEKHKHYKKLFERSQRGKTRIIRGYVLKTDDAGMIQFLDAELEASGDKAERTFYMKNVKELTLRLTKYVVR